MKEFWIVLCLLVSATLTHAQTNDTKQATTAKAPGANSAALTEEELKLRERRAKARALLVSLSSDARAFHDQTLRARSLARIADALWRVDAEQGRLLFRKAWEAAEVSDQEGDRKLQEEINKQKSVTGGGYAVNLPPNVRQEVLRLAARHDRVLGEEFLEKYKAQKMEAANSATTAKPNPNRLNEALSQRIGVASQLLQLGETDRALDFADPALSFVTTQTINFLSEVREKNAAAADKRYAALLSSAANNPQADANTVSLLSSYIFTPHLLVTFSGAGMSTSQSSSTITPAAVSPELRNAFYQVGGTILLHPLPAPGQADQTSAGVDGKYLAIKRMLPFFEQGAPPETVEALRTHLNALNTVVSEDARRRDDDWINRGLKSEKPATDREQYLLERIDRAKTSAERDSLYIELAYNTSSRGDARAREFVSKIEDSEIRKQLQAYIDPSLATYYVGKKDVDQALEMAHKGELTHIHKTWVLTECAKILAKTDRDKALELIDEAETEARRIEPSDPSLVRGLLAVANAFKVVDPARVWDATFDAVKAANSAEAFTGEDGELVMKFQSKGTSSVHTSDVAEFDLDGIFRELAVKDYDRAVELARGFQAEGPRAVATIAIARAILEPKKK
ncbi:MAG TPA: hypothetical protein VGQ41_09530 [Pyrinomonadaceae bacterium]|jgi:hypothetical protein|nr:hypothetical protein [Pyrinomonadaceae bacterium]